MSNPFETPKADLTDGVENLPPANYELASKKSRLVAAIVDSLILIFAAWLVWFLGGFDVRKIVESYGGSVEFAVISFWFLPTLHLLINGYHLHTKGQTLGKALVYIQIVSINNNKIKPSGKCFY